MTTSFAFGGAGELSRVVKFLGAFDETIKFTLERKSNALVLQVSTERVPPCSFTTARFENTTEGKECRSSLIPGERTQWAISSDYFLRVLRCFDEQLGLTLEVDGDVNSVLLYQKQETDVSTRVAQIRVYHQLGPDLHLAHNVVETYELPDVTEFRLAAQSVAVDEDEKCRILLHREKVTGFCYLTLKTDATTSSVRLGLSQDSGLCQEATARSGDLSTFGALCTQLKPLGTRVFIGFSDGAVALLRLQWKTKLGEHNVSSFVCAG